LARLSLFLLGFPRAEHDGAPVGIDRRKAVALLAYLATVGARQSRDALATLLWPDAEPRRAYAYLRNALWVLNQTPVAGWLETDRESVGLRQASDLWVDVDQFRARLAACLAHDHPANEVCPACLPLLTEAVELYRDDFMVGFTLSDSAPFDEWQWFETETLRRDLAGVLERLVRFHDAQDAFEPAIACAGRWLALDSLNEPVHRRLMTLYARAGRRPAALRQYEECARILQEGLGLAPEAETVELYEHIRAGELGSAREEQSTATIWHNLPAQPTPFLGRETELTHTGRLLQDPECRLLTITGLGGSGKTRLALQAAGQCVAAFPDGVYFIPLAPVSTPRFLVSAIVDALHAPVRQRGSEELQALQRGPEVVQTQLLDYLRERRMLLVLDNVEHLLEGAELFADILRHAPGVKLLVTSRERLNLQGEWVLEIEGLHFPAQEMVTATYETYSAMQLFLQSARRADAGFSPTAADVTAVAHVCRLVEGVPLGIELAAPWVKVLSCQEIAREIEVGLDFLTTSLRDVPERHRSMRAVFEQSWTLLSESSRASFRKLSVFRGGFTRDAAEAVADASLSALSSLVDKSLLRRTPANRYEMHDLLRQYAEEKLEGVPPESEAVRDRYSGYYLQLLKQLEAPLKSSGQKAALEELSREMENVRAAWRWATERGKIAEIQEAALSLFLYYDIRSRFQEGAEMFGEAASVLSEQGRQDTDALLGLLLAVRGWFLSFSALAKIGALFEQSWAYLEPLGPGRELAFANVLAAFANVCTTLAERERRLRESLAVYQARDDRWGMAVTLEALAHALSSSGEDAAARDCVQQSLQLRRQAGDQWGMAMSLFSLGRLDEREGMLQSAEQRYQESLEMRRDLGEDLAGVEDCLNCMARVARRTGDYDRARRLYLQTLAIARELGSGWRIARSLGGLGLVAFDLEKYTEAGSYFEESITLFESLCLECSAARYMAAMGSVAFALGDHEEARRSFEQSLETDAHTPWAPLGLGRLSHALGDETAAGEHFGQALRYAIDCRVDEAAIEALIGLAQLRCEGGAPEEAVQLLGLVLNHHAIGHRARLEAEGLLADASNALPAHAVEAALARAGGRELATVAGEILEGTGLRKA
jgi:predicted ATPase/DNA-binding SARP family transcriptional activator